MDHTLKKWSPSEIRELKRLVARNDLFYSEIAKKLRLKPIQVSAMAKKLGLKAPAQYRKGKWNSKHSHLREPVMRYFLKHTSDECQKKFKLTKSEFKSLCTASYKMNSLKNLRKDKRNHEAWDLKEWLFLIRHSGIKERQWIEKKLKRGNSNGRCIKERIQKAGGGSTRYLNGMPKKWAAYIWPEDLLPLPIKTHGGASKGFRTLIIPWVECERLSKAFVTDETVKTCIKTMANFQRFIFGTPKANIIIKRMKESIKYGK